jgi:hypothetical protein
LNEASGAAQADAGRASAGQVVVIGTIDGAGVDLLCQRAGIGVRQFHRVRPERLPAIVADADALMLNLAGAAHAIEWATERFWRRVDRLVRSGGRAVSRTNVMATLAPGVVVIDDEAHVAADAVTRTRPHAP